MALIPFAKLRETLGPKFGDGHGAEDVALIEPYQKGREYGPTTKIHAKALVGWVAKDGKPVSVGRDARATLMLDHPAVSRLHAVIAFTPQGWKAMDRSSNGSWLDGKKMPREQAVDMGYGVGLRLGRAVVVRVFPVAQFLQYAAAAPAAPAAPAATAAPASAPASAPSTPYPFPAAPAPPAAPPVAPAPVAEFDFEFGPELPPIPAAPTVRMNRGDLSGAPAPPDRKKPESQDGIDFEFDFDFG